MHKIMTLAVCAALVPLSACNTTKPALTPFNNPSVYSLHQPVVQRSDFVLDLRADAGGLAAGERERLLSWFESIELQYGDRLFVDEPAGYGGGAARANVSTILADYGLGLTEGAPVTTGEVAPGSIRVIASRATASVPSCPNWEDNVRFSSSSLSTNYGCAANSNLAAMVADPNDLVLGQPGSLRSSANTASRAIRVFRERQPTGSQTLQATSSRGN